MKIATIGSGKIGGTLGRAWAVAGHQVMFSSRHPDSAEVKALLAEAGAKACAGSARDAFAFGDVLLLAFSGTALEDVLRDAGDVAGKIVIDATNRFDGKSNARLAMQLLPGARVVKAFNSVGWEVVANPSFAGERPSMLMAGDDAQAKAVVAELIQAAGFEPADLGDAGAIPGLEAFTGSIWFRLANQYGRKVAIRVIKPRSG